MFQITNKMVKVTSVITHKETDEKGEEYIAVDVGISAPMENDVLDEFHSELRPAFYKGDGQDDMVSGQRLTHLRLPMPRFPWKGTLEGYTTVFHTGIGGSSEIKLTETDINKVFFLLKDKATVDMDYILRARIHKDDVANLIMLRNEEVHISLVPPDEKKQFELEQAKKNRKRALEDHFSAQPPAAPDDGDGDDRTGDLPLDEDADNSGQDPDFREVDQVESTDQVQYPIE